MANKPAIINATVIALLVLILGATLIASRFDYDLLVQRQETAEDHVFSLEKGAATHAHELAGYIRNTEELIEVLREELVAVREQLSIINGRLTAPEKALGALTAPTDGNLEESTQIDEVSRLLEAQMREIEQEEVGGQIELFSDWFRTPISLRELPEEFRAQADRMPDADAIDGLSADEFLRLLVEAQLVMYPVVDAIPESTRRELSALFDRYRMTADVISLDQCRKVDKLVAEANKEEQYVEWSIDGPEPDEKELTGGVWQHGIMRIEKLAEEGVHRLYRFSYEDNEQIAGYEDRFENLRRHIFRELYYLTQEQPDGSESGG